MDKVDITLNAWRTDIKHECGGFLLKIIAHGNQCPPALKTWWSHLYICENCFQWCGENTGGPVIEQTAAS